MTVDAEHPGVATVAGARDGNDQIDRAVAFLLRSTQHRPQTEAELAAKLRRRDVADDVAAAALQRARDIGVVDDRAFAHAWVDDRGRQRGYGVGRLRQELRRRLVPEPLVEEALAELDGRDDLSVATDLARRRAATMPSSLDPAAVARRLQGFLVRRGHPVALAQRVAIAVSGLDRHRDWD